MMVCAIRPSRIGNPLISDGLVISSLDLHNLFSRIAIRSLALRVVYIERTISQYEAEDYTIQ